MLAQNLKYAHFHFALLVNSNTLTALNSVVSLFLCGCWATVITDTVRVKMPVIFDSNWVC